jgi:hypothetical protein
MKYLLVTKAQLTEILFADRSMPLSVRAGTGTLVIFSTVAAIEREDGSGKSFNITGYRLIGGCTMRSTLHIRIAD